MSIGRWSVHNPVLLNVLMVTILVLGAFSLSRLPREQFSEVPFFWATITVAYPGVSAEDVEQSVTVPIENEMDGLKKLKKVRSITREGLSLVQVEFEDDISREEFERLFQEVQTRFNKVDLPEGTLEPVVDDFSSSDFLPVVEVIVFGEAGEEQLNQLAKRLEERLERVPEVEAVNLEGARDRQFRIEVEPDKAQALGLSLSEISRAVQGRGVTIPGGTLETPSREYLLRTDGEVQRAEDLAGIVVRGDPSGGLIRLSDFAAAHDTLDPNAPSVRFNGKSAVTLQVTKVVGGNSIAVVDGVREAVRRFTWDLPPSVDVTLFNDSTVRIRDSISVLAVNALTGLLLLITILGLFLGLRNALITALGIPMAFALTFVVLEWRGETLNGNSLFALVLVLGMLVDHAIVVIENSYRLRREGLSREDAAIRGADTMAWPVLSATLTTVAAFLPLMILPGILGRFLRVIPFVVSIALVVSTLEAFAFLPLHFAEWSGAGDSKAGAWFEPLEQWFAKVIAGLHAWRYLVIGGGFVVMVGLLSAAGLVPQNLFQGEDYTYFFIDLELPAGSPRSKTRRIVAQFEERILPLVGKGEVVSVQSIVGRSDAGGEVLTQSNAAQIVVDLVERKAGRTRPIDAVLNDIRRACAAIPGTESVFYRTVRGGPPVDPPISFRIFGDNYEDLEAVADRFKRDLASYPELYNVSDNLDRGTPELRVTVDRDRSARFGLSVAAVGSYLRASFDGITATRIFDDNEQIDIIVQYRGDAVQSVEELTQLKIPTPSGGAVPFSAVCRITPKSAIGAIKREEGKREVTVTAEAWDKKNIRAVNSTFAKTFESELKPAFPGVRFEAGGEFAEFNNILIQIFRLFLVGVFLIYLILGTQFKSYAQPFLILFTVPFSFAGIILYLLVSGTPFSTTVLYAGVALAGIAVNDSIVLISRINELRRNGTQVREAILTAARLRLRPIVLTSVTTIAGLLPTALGLGGYSPVWGPMAATVCVGLVFSTLTSVVAVPCMYGVFDDIAGRLGKRMRLHG